MFKKKEYVAMLLAGGQGSRLYTLTDRTAKPAVPFGGKYRIIDFPLSNCINSGIDTVGVLTQYQPLVLNEYIGNGAPWDMDRTQGGVTVLPPYQAKKGADWYKGTANAIYQNLRFIERYDPEYVIILSGDHIYKMDYSEMLTYHKKKKADCTIAVIDVPIEEASRFGIMNCNDDGSIYRFDEKPAHPESTKASMGIYIFSRDILYKYLREDEANPASDNDFGKNVIPAMLAGGQKLFAYPFEGYWKDVGTIDSLFSANMDLLGENPVFDITDRSWRIFSRTSAMPPQHIGAMARIHNSIISEGCEIYGTVENSVLGNGIHVEEGAVVRDCVIFSDVTIGAGSTVEFTITDSQTAIGRSCRIGSSKECGKLTVIGSSLDIPDGTTVPAGEMMNSGEREDI